MSSQIENPKMCCGISMDTIQRKSVLKHILMHLCKIQMRITCDKLAVLMWHEMADERGH